MRIAFHAPMKPPDHPVPSGDRQMARLLMAALHRAGHDVALATRFRSFDGTGDARRQRRLAALGRRMALRLVRRWRTDDAAGRPDLWFTYHLHHKAPDRLGPEVSAALAIPYVIAEASHAAKQASGPWAEGHAAAARAIGAADAVLALNSADIPGVLPLLATPRRLSPLPPFIDAAPFRTAGDDRARHRHSLRMLAGGVDDEPLLLTVAMMRPGAKLRSYRVLGAALGRLASRPWRLVVAGDGPASAAVNDALAPLGRRVVHLGALDAGALPAVYAGADLFLWPAVDEAFGLVFLEAQAAGLPVVAGRTGGVPDVVADGITGSLAAPDDAAAFADAVAMLLDDPQRAAAMGRQAAARVAERHDLPAAAATLAAVLASLTPPRRRPQERAS